MSIVSSKNTADATGYVLPMPDTGVGQLVVACDTGTIWVSPVVNAKSTPATPTVAAIPAAAGQPGDQTNYVKIVAGANKTFDLSSGFAVDNQSSRYTHLLIWSVTASLVTMMGA